MVDYGEILAFLTIIILVLSFGYTIIPHHDPIIGSWQWNMNNSTATISFTENGEFYGPIFTFSDMYGYKHGLAPIKGTWKRELSGKYTLSGDWKMTWIIDSSRDIIYNENSTDQIYFRIKNSVK